MLRSLVLVLALCLSLPLAVHSQTSTLTYYLCAILQGSKYQSIDQAVLVVNSSTSMQSDYNGKQNTAYQVLNITSGTRTYTDLTAASPTAVSVAMQSLAPPGSTGGNDNYFWPGTTPQMLDGNGLTFNFVSPVTVSGQAATGTQMNLWWESGSNSLGEEVRGGTHESAPLQSTLIISTTQPACTVPTYAQFSMCLGITGNGYTAALSGFVNTTGTPSTIAASAANGLSSSEQGWTITSISNGQRVYTPSSGSATTTAISSVAAANSIVSNDNLVYPDYSSSGVFDLQGVGFTLSSAAPIAGGSAASTIAIKYANGQYYEQSASSTESSTTSFIGFTPYIPGTSVPPCQAIPTTYQYCWSVQGSNAFSSVISGVLTINPLAAGTATVPYWTILTVSGTRVYTDLTTGTTTTSTITGLLPTGSIGGNDNRLYIGQTQLLDGDGISVSFNNVPPIFGQNVVNQTQTMVSSHRTAHSLSSSSSAIVQQQTPLLAVVATPSLTSLCCCSARAVWCQNLWYNNPTFLEENEGGTHETNATSSSFTIQAVSTGTTAAPTCSGNNSNGAGGQSSVSYLLMLTLAAAALVHALLA